MDTQLTRRSAVRGLAASLAGALAFPLTANAEANPTDQELTRYYAFLWFELGALSKELGLNMMDGYTIIRNDDQKIMKNWFETAPRPSARCKVVLEVPGIELRQLPSNPRYPKSEDEYNAMIDRIWSA